MHFYTVDEISRPTYIAGHWQEIRFDRYLYVTYPIFLVILLINYKFIIKYKYI